MDSHNSTANNVRGYNRQWFSSIFYCCMVLILKELLVVSGFVLPSTSMKHKLHHRHVIQWSNCCRRRNTLPLLYRHGALEREATCDDARSCDNNEMIQEFSYQYTRSTTTKDIGDAGSCANHFLPRDGNTYGNTSGIKIVQNYLSTISLALILSLSVGPIYNANAGFGPSSGATTSSPPNLVAPAISQDKDIANQQKKLKQLIGSTLDEKRLQQFSEQLDNLTNTIRNIILEDEEENTTTPTVDMDDIIQQKEQELEKARTLQQQIIDREKLLSTLEKQPYWFNYLAAFIGSVASTLVMHPVDTIKTRLQVKKGDDDTDDDNNNNSSSNNNNNSNSQGVGNIKSLYEGLSGNILKEGPPSALYLGVYETVKYNLLPRFDIQYQLLVYLIAGAAGEMVGSVVRAPAEAIKSTVQSGISSSATEAAAQVFGTKESRTNVIRAWSSSVWRDVPFGAIQLAIFELTKTYILNNPNIDFDSSTLLSEAIIGAFAGGWGALLTNPFDIITTRIITQSVLEDSKPLGVIDMVKKVYDEGGLLAFTVGWEARVGYWAPAISIFLTCYCSVRQAGVANNWF